MIVKRLFKENYEIELIKEKRKKQIRPYEKDGQKEKKKLKVRINHHQ